MNSSIKVGDVFETKYGKLKVLDYINARNVVTQFENTGYVKVTQTSSIRNDLVKDPLAPSVYGIGYLGEGDYTTRELGAQCPIHKRWMNIMGRCYGGYKKAYIGCTVAKEWHNFQNFAQWMDETYPIDGEARGGDISYQLDKDIKYKGNRIYSPETCMWVTQQENLKAINEYPIGGEYEQAN
ncbi:TPA: hypothetical protein RSW61_001933 [Vibrio harveyi]|nr:hypothetical protein [Vibrio harveyi]